MKKQPLNHSHNDIAARCRYTLVEARVCRSEPTIPMKPWDKTIFDFAEANTHTILTMDEVIEKFKTEVIAKYKRTRKRLAKMKKVELASTTSKRK